VTCPDCPRPPWRLTRWLRKLWVRLQGRRPVRVAVWRVCRACHNRVAYEEWV
jgi:hypothetical protein